MEFDTLNERHPPAGEEFDLDGLVLVGGARLDLGAYEGNGGGGHWSLIEWFTWGTNTDAAYLAEYFKQHKAGLDVGPCQTGSRCENNVTGEVECSLQSCVYKLLICQQALLSSDQDDKWCNMALCDMKEPVCQSASCSDLTLYILFGWWMLHVVCLSPENCLESQVKTAVVGVPCGIEGSMINEFVEALET